MNLPEEFLERIRRQIPHDFDLFKECLAAPPPTTLRVHPVKLPDWNSFPRLPWCETGVELEARPIFTLDPLLHAGCYYVQEASSTILEQVVHQFELDRPNLKVLDLCAAPGGKSTHLLSLIDSSSLLIANEVIRNRAWILAENLAKWGGFNFAVTNNDPADFSSLPEMFDVLLVDAPCSGEGLFRKDLESVQQWSMENLKLCSMRQKRILSDALASLKIGGRLIYSTCTFNPDENEEIVRWLVTEQACSVELIELDPAFGFVPVEICDGLAQQAFPHRVRGEGFFITALTKHGRTSQVVDRLSPRSRKKSRPSGFTKATRTTNDHIEFLLGGLEDGISLMEKESTVFAVRQDHANDIRDVVDALKLLTVGVEVAELKGQHPLPAHGLAVSGQIDLSRFPMYEVDQETAIRYLQREPIDADVDDGFALITFRNHPLGWIKKIGNRANNRYPQQWRIRMPRGEHPLWTIAQQDCRWPE